MPLLINPWLSFDALFCGFFSYSLQFFVFIEPTLPLIGFELNFPVFSVVAELYYLGATASFYKQKNRQFFKFSVDIHESFLQIWNQQKD